MRSPPLNFDIDQLNLEFETQSPQDILAWSWGRFQTKIVASSSFQTQSVALLHMVSQVCPDMKVLFLDTGFHFGETLAYRDNLQDLFNLKIKNIYPDPETTQHLRNPSDPLYFKDPDLCCRINKIRPMERAILGIDAWVSGIRRDQTPSRRDVQIFERQNDNLVKIHPLAMWTKRDLWSYINHYQLPLHPLFNKGYTSIGCTPCTRPIIEGGDERAGRWEGQIKTECGLHTNIVPSDSILNDK